MAKISGYDSGDFMTIHECNEHAKTNPIIIDNMTPKFRKDGYIINDVNTILDPYWALIESRCIEVPFKAKYKFNPKFVSKEYYGTVDLFFIILKLNKVLNITDFNNFDKIKILDPNYIQMVGDIIGESEKTLKTVVDINNLTLRPIT